MKKLLVVLMLVAGAVSFSASTQNTKKSKINNSVNEKVAQNLSFSTITLKLTGSKLGAGLPDDDKNKRELEYENFTAIDSNKKTYTEKDLKSKGKNPKIFISKEIARKMMENFVNSDEEIVVTGFYEGNTGIKYEPFNFSFTVNKDGVKEIKFKDGAIYIWDK